MAIFEAIADEGPRLAGLRPAGGRDDCAPGCAEPGCAPCVARLSSPADRMAALRAAVEREQEPLVTLTHLLHLCRDEHRVLWEHVAAPDSKARVAAVLAELACALPAPATVPALGQQARRALAGALGPAGGVAPVVVAHAIAQLIDERYGHTFTGSLRRRGPYQPGVGDPVPLGNPDLRGVLDMRPTSPPWRLANRLDETRRIRLAGEWATQFRIVFDYSLLDTLSGLVTAETVVATCHPNRTLDEFDLPPGPSQPGFWVRPRDPGRQQGQVSRLIGQATAAAASIVVLPELCMTESLAWELRDWVRRPDGPRLLVAGSYHHEDNAHDGTGARRRNTAIAWVRGHDQPLTHDKYSPADRPVIEDLQPDGWPALRVYVTADGWHLVIAVCRDLLNPEAVHALTEAGVNLVLVPAMSQTLVPFGGPAAQLVGAGQALVAIANNPADWTGSRDPGPARPARALFGHPGLGQQTRLVPSADAEPGVATLAVRSAQVGWLAGQGPRTAGPRHRTGEQPPSPATPAPWWAARLAGSTRRSRPGRSHASEPVTLRPAAVLVLLTDSADGPAVLLTERAPDLGDYPGQLVFPGGASDPHDDGPVATALREAREEVGLHPGAVRIIGELPPLALPESGFLVTPVVAWSAQLPIAVSCNLSEVTAVHQVPLRDIAARPGRAEASRTRAGDCVGPDLASLGRMTGSVLDALIAILDHPELPGSMTATAKAPA